jgi:hypothetical protein
VLTNGDVAVVMLAVNWCVATGNTAKFVGLPLCCFHPNQKQNKSH